MWKQFKDDWKVRICCSVNCLHKRVRLYWTTTHCRCILDEIGMKLFLQLHIYGTSLDDRSGSGMMSITSWTLNIYGTSLDDRSGSGMMSITSWTLNVHCIRNVMKFLWSWLRGSFRAWWDVVLVLVWFNRGHTRYWVTMWLLRWNSCAIWRGVLRYAKVLFQWKLDIMIAKASNIDGFNILFHFVFIPFCILKIKWKLLNLCLIVYFWYRGHFIRCSYTTLM